MRSLMLQLLAICAVQALENPIPSSFLQPRNFNPHPYQADAREFLIIPELEDDLGLQRKFLELSRRFANTAPLQFPANPDTDQQQEQQRSEQQQRIISHIVQNQALIPHPYERLALNYRSQQLQRFNGNDDQAPRVFSALANHARKVQNNEFQHRQSIPRAKYHNSLDDSYNDETDPLKSSPSNHDKKRYRFSYAVRDDHSGDDFSHTQKQENGAVHGSYKVHLPDGRMQIVKYTADDVHGYRAQVSYEDDVQPAPVVTQPRVHYPQVVKQVEINNVRHTVTPTPYLSSSEYNIRAPSARRYYPSTTVVPKHYY